MSGDTIPRRVVIHSQSSPGDTVPPLRVVMERAQRTSPIWKSKKDRKLWLLTAWQGMGQYWIDEYLPMRFVKGYTKNVLGYRKGGKDPLVETGRLRQMALSQSRADAKGTADKPRVEIIIKTPPYVNYNKDVNRALRTVPPSEVARMAPVLQRELILGARSATITRTQRGSTAGQLRASLSSVGASTDLADRAQRKRQLNKQLGIRGTGRRQQLLQSIKGL